MNTLFNFVFWTSAYFFLLALVYQFLVKHQANPGFSRGFILIGIVISLAFGTGFLVYSPGLPVSESSGMLTLPEVVVYASESLERSQWQIREFVLSSSALIYVSLLISALIFLRFAASLIYLSAKWKLFKSKRINGLIIIPVKEERSPFSFFRLVFVPEQLLDDPAIDKVLLHEQAHIRKLHTIDLIFMEIVSILFWFHPVVWYLRREVKMQHEFEADRYVLDQQVDKVAYQQLLVNYSFGSFQIPITNPFNFSPLKKRIMMMNKKSKKSFSGMIPGLLFSIFLFSGMLLLQSAGLNADQLPQKPDNPNLLDPVTVVANQPGAPDVSASDQNNHNVLDQFIVVAYQPVSANDIAAETPPPVQKQETEDEIFTKVESPPTFPGGESARIAYLQQTLRYPAEAREVGMQGTVFVSFVVEKDGSLSGAKVLRGVGEPIDNEALRVINEMPKWVPGTQRGENVRVQFNMPIRFVLNGSDRKDDESARSAHQGTRPPGMEGVVIFIDGQKIDTEIENMDEIIKPREIESINVFKGEKARELYGYENVIAIKRKKTDLE